MAKTKSSSKTARVPAKRTHAAAPKQSRAKTARTKPAAKKPPVAKKQAASAKAAASKRTPPPSRTSAPRAAHVWPGLPPGYFDRAR
jgi:hypothetical protein